MYMKQLKTIINSSWAKSAAVAAIGVVMISEGHVFYSGLAFGFAAREFLLMLKPTVYCSKCEGCEICNK